MPREMRPIEETTVLITGATDGLGRGVARDLAARGAKVLLHGRSREKLDDARAPSSGGRCPDVPGRPRLARRGARARGGGRGATRRAPRADQQRRHRRRRARRHDAPGEQGRRRAPLRGQPPRRLPADAARSSPCCAARSPPASCSSPRSGRRRSTSTTRCSSAATAACARVRAEQARADHDRLRARRSARPDEVTVTSLHPSTYMPTKMVLEAAGARSTRSRPASRRRRASPSTPSSRASPGRFYDRQRESTPDPQASDPRQRKRLWALSLELVGKPEPAL